MQLVNLQGSPAPLSPRTMNTAAEAPLSTGYATPCDAWISDAKSFKPAYFDLGTLTRALAISKRLSLCLTGELTP